VGTLPAASPAARAGPAPVVELRAARKRYGEVEALRGVDLAIQLGEVVALLGPNGAGKTTTLNLALGLRRPTAGSARLFGLDPTDRRARSRCGVVLQESGVTGVLTVSEIVELVRSYYPAPLPAGDALAMAGLRELGATRVGALSGGQRQRLFFALAVCGDPQALFLDEPTVGMDVEARQVFLASLRRFAAAGKTIVLTTHYLEEADQLARRIVVIDRGVVIADATPAEVKARVAGRRVSFRTAGPLAPAALDGLPVQSVEVADHRVSLLSNEPETVLRELFARGLTLADLEVVGASLEEALLSLTHRGERRA
jgi:ABC-2 type transport system ATP-binding protein